jgi:hypothetical protein
MSHKRILYRKRDFLNKENHHSLSAIFGEIIAEWKNVNDEKNGLPPIEERVTFNITDCNRKIDLQFDTKDENQLENSLQKISKLANFVNEFKDKLYLLAEMLEDRRNLQQINNEMDTIYERIRKWFEDNKSNDVDFELERKEGHEYILWIENDQYFPESYWNKLVSFINDLNRELDTNINTYLKN